MPNRILIIGSDFSQEMPSGMMDRFSNVKMIVNKGKNSMSMEMVSQLLMIQSQYKIQIDLVQIDSKDREDFNMQFALRLGLLLSEDDVEITFLSDDTTFDHIFEVCKDLHLRVSRMSALGSDNGVSTAKDETPAPSFSRRRQPEPEPSLSPSRNPSPSRDLLLRQGVLPSPSLQHREQTATASLFPLCLAAQRLCNKAPGLK